MTDNDKRTLHPATATELLMQRSIASTPSTSGYRHPISD